MLFLDSDILIEILRRRQEAIAWAASNGDEFMIAGFTAMELLAGSRNAGEQATVNEVLQDVRIVWPSSQACDVALNDYRLLHLRSGIGFIDTLIAQPAIEVRLPLYTFNIKHFQHVPQLQTIQPYQRP